jgi:uncharacterized protein (DUF2236 family)
MRRELVSDSRTRQVAQLVLGQRASKPVAEPLQAIAFQAAIDLLPAWARHLHGFSDPTLLRPIIHVGTLGIARTLRWAFR